MATNFVHLTLHHIGSALLFSAEPSLDGPQSFPMDNVQTQRLRNEADALKALEAAGIGQWSRFPSEGIFSTITPSQLRLMGFKGNY